MESKNFIITLTGNLGSGKSKVGQYLKDKLGFIFYSTGSIQRKIAQRKNMSTLELNLFSEKNREIDDEIDGFTQSLRHSQENLIIDSRLAWHFIPHSFKVFLYLKHQVAAERIFHDKERKNEYYTTLKDALVSIEERQKSEVERFKKLYQVDLYDFNNYDLILNTEKVTVEEIGETIISFVDKKVKKKNPHKMFF